MDMRASSDSNKFLKQLDGLSSTDINARFSELGSSVAGADIADFEQALREYLQPGIIDITNWAGPAVRSLIIVASERSIQVNLKRAERTISPLSWPRSDTFLDYFVEQVIISEPW
jgi:hypothetical protein